MYYNRYKRGDYMNYVEPIRDLGKIEEMKVELKKKRHEKLFAVSIGY